MKIAILLVGHFRTFDLVKDSFIKNVIEANAGHEIDIYIHTWKSLGYSSVGTDILDKEIHQKLIEKFGLSRHHDTNSPDLNIDIINDVLRPKDIIVEDDNILQTEVYDKMKTPKNSHSFYPNTYAQFRKLFLCNEMCKKTEISYDLVIKTRPDIYYTKPIIFEKVDPGTIILQDHYVNDLLYYGSTETMETISNIFQNLNVNRPLDPHALLNQHISINKLTVDKRKLGIQLMRKNGDIISYE